MRQSTVTVFASTLGGLVAQAYGIIATFWTAAAAMAVLAVVAWRPLSVATATFLSAPRSSS